MQTLSRLLLTTLFLLTLACEKTETGLRQDLHMRAFIDSSEWVATDIFATYSSKNNQMLIFGSKRATQQLPEERLQVSFFTPTLSDSLHVQNFESSLEIITNGTKVTTKYEKLEDDSLTNFLYITEFDTLNNIIEGHFGITFNQSTPKPGELTPVRFSDGAFKIRYEWE